MSINHHQSIINYLEANQISDGLLQTIDGVITAGKQIRSLVLVAGLNNHFGNTNTINIQGEEAQKLDILANDILKNILFSIPQVGVIASEEDDSICESTQSHDLASSRYAVLLDPLDGSSNIDVNVSIGTIFSIYEMTNHTAMEACLNPGRHQVAAGYILYGTSTVLVLALQHGNVVGFTYDPKADDFFLSHANIMIPNHDRYYSVNEGNMARLLPESVSFINHAKNKGLSTRYIGSLVADFHRNLLKGGIYMYPQLKNKPKGKLRLLYEGNPLAFICEKAGGKATNGSENILDIKPTELHQRTPLFIGNASLVDQIRTEAVTQ